MELAVENANSKVDLYRLQQPGVFGRDLTAYSSHGVETIAVGPSTGAATIRSGANSKFAGQAMRTTQMLTSGSLGRYRERLRSSPLPDGVDASGTRRPGQDR
jgi:hypothetical protein